MKYLLLLCLSGTGLLANAQRINPAAAKSAALYNNTIVQIKPAYKNYVTQTAKTFSNRKLNIDSLKSTMKAPGNSMFSALSNADISTLVFLVMQATAAENDADIRNMMADMEKNRQKKEALRKEEESINDARRKVIDSNKIKMPANTAGQAKRLAAIKNEKDTLDEMTAQDQLKLQQFMEKKNQLEQMISNLMKAAEDAQNTLSKNLKAS